MQSHALSFDLVTSSWSAATLPALDSPRTLVMAFGAPELIDQPAAFELLSKSYPRSLVIGCSSAGEIHGTTVRDHSLAVTVTRFDKTELQLASLEVRSAADSFAAGSQLAKRLATKPGLRGILVLSEGLNVNGSELIRGLNEVLDESVVVTGGLSGDGASFKRTWVAVGNRLKSNVVAAVGFYGDHVIIGHGSKGGWDKFGPERAVTKAEGNVLYELDGRPALQLYKEYLGDKAKELPASGLLFPLSLRASSVDDKFVVRTLLSVDHERNSLTFAGDIPKGHLAQLMKADFDRLIDGAGVAGQMTTATGAVPPNSDALVVAISCVGRRLVLGARVEEEVEAVRDAVHSDRAHITGFYSYGEISPYATGHCDLHNQTMTLTVFSESPTPLARPAARGSQPALRSRRADTHTEVEVPRPAHGFAVADASFDHQTKSWSRKLPALDSPRTLVLGFGAPELIDDPRAFEELARAYPRSLVIGCSSAGEIHGTTVRDHSLAVTVTRFDKTELQLASLEVRSAADSFAAGSQLAKRLATKPGLRGILVLSEGLNVNGSELIRGLNEVLDESVVVTGGLSGDGASFKRTWVAVGNRLKSNVVAAVGFYGDHVIIGHGSKGGWDKFGPERAVTKAEGNVLYELDGRPALQLYKEYLGDKAKELPASGLLFPLSLRASSVDDKFVVRTLLSVDHERNSLTFAGDIPKGHLAQLMKADFDRLIDGAGVAGSMTAQTGAPPANADALVVAISCVGRRLVLGARVEEEVEAVRDAVHSDRAHITGFYSYGEISPYATGHCDLHNQTMTLTVFSESPTPLARPAARGSQPVIKRPTINTPVAVPIATPTSVPIVRRPTAPAVRETLPPMPAVAPPSGPIVRLPHPSGGDAAIETSMQGNVQIVRITGRITEAFKGDQLGRMLGRRVAFDLSGVDRVTSFGVREWLAMLSSATQMTESYFLRCSESIVNQLTMIRKFDGGARVVSFFGPYLCTGCGAQVERMLDCERDSGELAVLAPVPVKCPRCDAEARFDDDPRTYFAFASHNIGVAVPADVRAIQDALNALAVAPVVEDVEKTIEHDVTRIRVNAKLTAQIRWRKILDGIEGELVIDLAATPASDVQGIANLEQALHALPAEVTRINVEHAPAMLIERMISGSTQRRIHIVSAVITGYCPSCAVHRPAPVRLDQYAADVAAGREHQVVCKRCNGSLELAVDNAFQRLVALQRPKRESSPPPVVASAPAAVVPAIATPPVRRGMPWGAVLLVIVLAGAVGALGVMVYTGRTPLSTAAPATSVAPAPVVSAPAPAAPAPAGAPAGWQGKVDLPPPWVERAFSLDADTVYVVGHATAAASPETGLELARQDATMRLVDQLYGDLAGSPVHEFLDKRIKRDAPGAARAVADRFNAQHGKETAFVRDDASTRKTADGYEVYLRYKLPKVQYDQLLAGYRTTARFRGFEVAQFFPLLDTAVHSTGQLIVIAVDKRGAADAAGIHEGDAVLKVGATPVATVDAFRSAANGTWASLEPRYRLTFEVETAGATRTVVMYKPAPVQP